MERRFPGAFRDHEAFTAVLIEGWSRSREIFGMRA